MATVSIFIAALTAVTVVLIYIRLNDRQTPEIKAETKTEAVFTPLTAEQQPLAPVALPTETTAPETKLPPVEIKKQAINKQKVSAKPIKPVKEKLDPVKPEASLIELCGSDQADCVSDDVAPVSSAPRNGTGTNSQETK